MLSDKVHATTPKGLVGGFEFTVFLKKFERMTQEAMDVCLWVLKESNKSRFDSYSVRNIVLCISHITFRDCRVHIFSDNLPRSSCMLILSTMMEIPWVLEGVNLFIIHSSLFNILFYLQLFWFWMEKPRTKYEYRKKKNSLRLEIRMLTCSLTAAKEK